ncbi:hypothetical protein VOLCADRAFT_96372 [Volvox carteri f. nagariensis]|uniref:Uncharacterized protein n=1 Tax=Volvox carteri f. nagariensis TaxID=3068 RepID=D8U9Y5_VOLCA|nr:uncharacterized protein VOLCADRAFT_96372 [Volvox carteri f. nagariensis]EFJ43492.1 hypothetical protein VOLCADRAFT_96372 [Volvox carteri f. nagariensis]|eukprot:XP_002955421.1 hypothetical protein VOLCADRAFT_96372 [Volvox carteri f. nagariensis]
MNYNGLCGAIGPYGGYAGRGGGSPALLCIPPPPAGGRAATSSLADAERRRRSYLHLGFSLTLTVTRALGRLAAPPRGQHRQGGGRRSARRMSPEAKTAKKRLKKPHEGSSVALANSATPGASTAPGFRSPAPPVPPATPPAASGDQSGPSSRVVPNTSADSPSPVGSGTSGGSRPPSGGRGGAGARAGSGGRGGLGGGRPPAAAAPRNVAAMPAAGRPSGSNSVSRTRDASPQRRSGGGGGGSTAAVATPLQSASPSPATTPQARGVAQLGDASSHLPPAAQRALAAAAALAGGADGGLGVQGYYHRDGHQPQQVQQAGDGAAKPAGLPQLPLALRRAMQRYRETMQTRDQLLLMHHNQQQQRRGDKDTGASSHSLPDTVSTAGRAYRSDLARLYHNNNNTRHQTAEPHIIIISSSSGSSSRVGGGGPKARAAGQLSRMSLGPGRSSSSSSAAAAAAAVPQSPGELRRRAQVVFAALVAAETWLIQSLSELARSRGTPGGGVAAASRRTAQADTCAALLADVELLRLELDDLQAQLRVIALTGKEAPTPASSTPSAPSPPPQPLPAAGMYGRVGNSDRDANSDGAASGCDAVAAAAVALEVDGQELEESVVLWRNRFLRALLGGAAGAGGGGGSGSGGSGGGPASRRSGSLPGPGAPLYRPLSTPSPLGGPAGDASIRMRRPLGFWLPDAISLQEAVAHGRAQLQLQATAFQLLLEGCLAAPLLPRQRPAPPPPLPLAMVPAAAAEREGHHGSHHYHYRQQQHQQHHQQAVAAGLAWERWLAQCRLAHLLLFKGAWNCLCSVVELEVEGEEEEEEEEEGGGVEEPHQYRHRQGQGQGQQVAVVRGAAPSLRLGGGGPPAPMAITTGGMTLNNPPVRHHEGSIESMAHSTIATISLIAA